MKPFHYLFEKIHFTLLSIFILWYISVQPDNFKKSSMCWLAGIAAGLTLCLFSFGEPGMLFETIGIGLFLFSIFSLFFAGSLIEDEIGREVDKINDLKTQRMIREAITAESHRLKDNSQPNPHEVRK